MVRCTIMLLLLASSAGAEKVEITSKGTVMRMHSHWQQGKRNIASQAVGSRQNHDGQKQQCLDTLTAILMKLETLDSHHAEDAKHVIKNIDAAAVQDQDVWKILQRDHAVVLREIETFSSSIEVDTLDPKLILTADCLDLINGRTQFAEFSNSSTIIGGDMEVIRGRDQALIQKNGQEYFPRLWPNPGRIPYCFSSSLAQSSQKAFKDAVAHIQTLVPCLRFVEVAVADEQTRYCTDKPGIFVKSDQQGCFASIGVQYPTSNNLQANACDTMGIAVHEIGHNLGMWHEQARRDNYKYIKILWDNIENGRQNQFKIQITGDVKVPYDFMSVMHYSGTAFGKRVNGERLRTIKKIVPSKRTMGQRMGLSYADALQLAQMYKCSKPADFAVCEGSDGCTKGPCTCHQTGNSKTIKTISSDGCQRCERECPKGRWRARYPCGCADGYIKVKSASGHYCKPAPPGRPTPAPRMTAPPAPISSPTPASPVPVKKTPIPTPAPDSLPRCPKYPNVTRGNCKCHGHNRKITLWLQGASLYYCKVAIQRPQCAYYPSTTRGDCQCGRLYLKISSWSGGARHSSCRLQCPSYQNRTRSDCQCSGRFHKRSVWSRHGSLFYCKAAS